MQNLRIVKDALKAANPTFCVSGDIPIERLTLHFSPEEESTNPNAIRFPLDNPGAITPLIEACKQAPFGAGQKAILDPEYRRALVLPGHRFAVAPATCVDPSALGILGQIQRILLSGSANRIYACLDKLNVYGVGDFFKVHVDTPRSNKMFGTLLINLPVKHRGGNLVVHAPGQSSKSWPTSQEDGQISTNANAESYITNWGDAEVMEWIAFFSDCPHEVLPVTQGNRVTLTFNLFFENDDGNNEKDTSKPQSRFTDPPVDRLVEALRLPGQFDESRPRLCFHLQHRYPVNLNDDCAESARQYLKGRDAVIYRALQKLDATISFHFVTRQTGYGLIGYSEKYGYTGQSDEGDFYILEQSARVIQHYTYAGYAGSVSNAFSGIPVPDLPAFTLVPLPRAKDTEPGPYACGVTGTKYVLNAYGNDPVAITEYASICMIACIPGHDICKIWPKIDPYAV